MKITKVLTGNGDQFTDRFAGKGKLPTGQHAFGRECALLGIEHRLIKPRHPQASGMVGCSNGRIGDIPATTCFRSCEGLQATLELLRRALQRSLAATRAGPSLASASHGPMAQGAS